MCPVERERGRSGCRASGLTPELPVQSRRAGFLRCWFRRCWFRRCWFRCCFVFRRWFRRCFVFNVNRIAVKETSRLLFSGLPLEVSSSPAVVVTKKLRILLVPATALSNRRFFAHFFSGTGVIQARTCIRSIGLLTLKFNKMHFNCSRHN